MQWIEAKVSVDSGACARIADPIAMIFYALGLKGVVIEDPDIAPDEDWGEDALGPPATCSVSGYFADTDAVHEKLESLEKQVRDMEIRCGFQSRIDYRKFDEKNWSEAWKAFFWPEQLTDHITVKPTWRPYHPRSGEIVVQIDPGMAFGTGTHPTTAMCVQLIETHLKKGQSFLDIGTGSGILMAVAAKLGAGSLYGIDNDDIAIEIAARNLAVNHVSRHLFKLEIGNLTETVSKRYDMIAANLLIKEVLVLLNDIPKKLAPHGIFICSGLLEKQYELFEVTMKRTGWKIIEILNKNEWIAIASRRKKS